MWIKFTIKTDQIFACWYSVGIIFQTNLCLIDHHTVGKVVGLLWCVALILYAIVIELGVISFQKLARVGESVIVLHTAAGASPFCIYVNGCLLVITFLRCNQNNACSTTCAIQRCTGSIFQNGDTLNITLGDVAQRCSIRCAIKDNQGLGRCI